MIKAAHARLGSHGLNGRLRCPLRFLLGLLRVAPFLVGLCLLGVSIPSAARASQPPACTAPREGQFGGAATWVIACPVGSRLDTAYVMGVATAEESLARASGVWLIDAFTDGSINLAIQFARDDAHLIARVYHDADGDGRIAYEMVDGGVRLTETPTPTLTIRAAGQWWQRDGLVNFNLRIEVDGPIVSLFGDESPGYPATTVGSYRTDGAVDATIQVYDTAGSGRPSVEIRQGYFRASDSAGVGRTHIMFSQDSVWFPFDPHPLFPYLGDPGYGIVLPYQRGLAPIQVDWQRSRIVAVGEFVPSRATNAGGFIYSLLRIEPGSPRANFENPFLFYDLARRGDGYPDLQIRIQHSVPHDPYAPEFARGRYPRSTQDVRYSWDQNHDFSWDYKLNLFGKHEMDSAVRFGELDVLTVPYDDAPYWVTNRSWDAAWFLEAPPGGVTTAEGIYEGYPSAELIKYATGYRDELPPGECDAPLGFRMECNFELQRRAMLYLSAVDRKLHLQHAREGAWRLSPERVLLYANRNGGPYVDTWRIVERGETVAELTQAIDHLILVDSAGIRLKRVGLASELFSTLPPRSAEEWQALGQALETYGLADPLGGADFEALFLTADGEVQGVPGARLSGFRPLGTGFQLVVQITEPSDIAPAWMEGLPPGSYLVGYTKDGGYTVEMATPPDLRLEIMPVMADHAVVGAALQVAFRAENHGSTSTGEIPVVLMAARTGEPAREVGRQHLTVDGNRRHSGWFTWRPPAEGNWALVLTTDDGTASLPGTPITIAPAGALSVPAQLSLQQLGSSATLVVAILLAAIALGAAFMSVALVSAPDERAGRRES